MGFFEDLFHPGRAFKEGQRQIQQGQQRAEGFQQPFMEMGQQQGQTLQDAISQLTHPQDFMNQLLEGYQESPYAQQLQDVAQERGQQAASQMGLSGSSPALQAITQQAGSIAGQDRQQYLQNLMDMYNRGTSLAGSMYGQGASTAGQMGQQALNVGGQLADLGISRRQAGPAMAGKVAGKIGDLATEWLTGGFGEGGYGRGKFAP